MGDYTKKSLFYINSAGLPVYVGDIVDVKEIDPYKELKYENEYLKEKVRCLEEKCDRLEIDNGHLERKCSSLETENRDLKQEINNKKYDCAYEKALKIMYPRLPYLNGHLTHGHSCDEGYFMKLETNHMNPADMTFAVNVIQGLHRK